MKDETNKLVRLLIEKAIAILEKTEASAAELEFARKVASDNGLDVSQLAAGGRPRALASPFPASEELAEA